MNVSTRRGCGHSVTIRTLTEQRVGELVRQRLADLSPAERRLGRTLLASYPIAGLESLARFAERAGVSPPTVTRFITRLGYRGYPEFQDVLRHEVQERLSSPLERYRDDEAGRGAGALLADALDVSRRNLQATVEQLSHHDLEAPIGLLSDVPARVFLLG